MRPYRASCAGHSLWGRPVATQLKINIEVVNNEYKGRSATFMRYACWSSLCNSDLILNQQLIIDLTPSWFTVKDLKCVSVLSAFFLKHYTKPIIHAGITIFVALCSWFLIPIIIISWRFLWIMWGNSTKTGKHISFRPSSTAQVLLIIHIVPLLLLLIVSLYLFSHYSQVTFGDIYPDNQAIQVHTLYVPSPSPLSFVLLVLLSSFSSHDHFSHVISAPYGLYSSSGSSPPCYASSLRAMQCEYSFSAPSVPASSAYSPSFASSCTLASNQVY